MGQDLIFQADTAEIGGAFDGVQDVVSFDAALGVFHITDGKTGAVRDVSAYTREGDAHSVAALRLDVDQDQDFDPYTVVRNDGVYALYVAPTGQAEGTVDPVAAWDDVLTVQGQALSASRLVIRADAGSEDLAAATIVTSGLPKAKFGDWGVDLSARDVATKPADDFFHYANGTWLNTTAIPDNRISIGVDTDLDDQARADVRAIAQTFVDTPQAEGSEEKKIADYYSAYLNTSVIDAKGLAPLADELAVIQDLKTSDDVARYFGETGWRGGNAPFGIYIGADDKNPDQNVTFIGTGALGMGGKEYYLEKGAEYDTKRAAYLIYLETLLTGAGRPDPKAEAKAILALETKMAALHWEDEDYDDAARAYNPSSLETLSTEFPDFNWAAFMQGAKISGDELIAVEKDRFADMAKVIKDTPIETWQAYFTAHRLNADVRVLPKTYREAAFNFFNKTLYGQTTPRERWEGAVYSLNEALPEAVGKAYVARHFPEEAKVKTNLLIDNLMSVYDEHFQNADWLDDASRDAVLGKRQAMGRKIGYPDKWEDYSALQLSADDAFGNARNVRAFYYDKTLNKLNKPVDRAEWGMSPQTVNAMYAPQLNDVQFPAAYLQAPQFDPKADPAVNYGAVGYTIGHEISHGFDNYGAQYGSQGELLENGLFTKEDMAEFVTRGKKLVKQFGAITVLPGLKINGEQTQAENIADLVGLTVAYEAYRKSLNGVEPPVINGLTGDQRFFLGFAQAYRNKTKTEALRDQVLTDTHAPDEHRVNQILRNFDPFYAAFNMQKGDKMYLPSEKRVKIY